MNAVLFLFIFFANEVTWYFQAKNKESNADLYMFHIQTNNLI